MKKENRDIWIGAAAVGGFALLVAFMDMGMSAVSKAGVASTRVVGKFNKVDGLTEGSAVRLGGIKVGRVAALDLDDKFRAIVTMDIDGIYKFPKDTSAAIHTDGLFGGKFVVLEPGAEEDPLQSGDEFVLTQDAVIVSYLLDLIISEGKVARSKRVQPKNQ